MLLLSPGAALRIGVTRTSKTGNGVFAACFCVSAYVF
jgi:hypothetical protein